MNFELPPVEGTISDHWYAEYLDSIHWQHVRHDALERARNRCQVCNSDELLQVHHRNYARLGAERPDDVTVLCRPCHELFHERSRVVPTGRRYESFSGVIGHVRIQPGVGTRDKLILYIKDDENNLFTHQMSYALHPNGSPHGGSRYRELWEVFLGRKVARGERFDPYALVGVRVSFSVVSYPDRPDIGSWITSIVPDRAAA